MSATLSGGSDDTVADGGAGEHEPSDHAAVFVRHG